MLIGLGGMALTYPRNVTGGGGASGLAAPFTRVNGPADDAYTAAIAGAFNGWSVDHASAISDLEPFDVDREGYNALAQATTHRDRAYVTRKVRQPAPNASSANLSPTTYALSNYVLDGNTLFGGATNNSSEISPKPIAKIVTLARDVIGNTIGGTTHPVEVIAGQWFARSRREVAAVKYIFSDGSNPNVEVVVSSTQISTNPYDRTSVTVFNPPDTDLSSLNDGKIAMDVEVYPWVGGAASVQKTVDWSNYWEFTTQYFLKNPTLLANRPVCWVGAGGTAGGTVGSGGTTAANATAAEANKFGTPKQAADAAAAALTTGTKADGLIIYFDDGTYDMANWSASYPQMLAVITLKRSPTSTNRASVILRTGASTWNPNITGSLISGISRGCVRFEDITHFRNGAQAIISGTPELQLVNCAHDNNGQTSSILVSSSAMLFINGLTPLATGNQRMAAQTTPRICLIRGWNGDAQGNFERLCIVGSEMLSTSALDNVASLLPKNHVIGYNKFFRIAGTSFWNNQGGDHDGMLSIGNVYEYTSTSSGHSMSMNNDSANYDAHHVISHNDTFVGWEARGRVNFCYDEGTAEKARTSRFCGYVAPILVSVYTKGDRFRYENESGTGGTVDGPTRLGNWAVLYGVGWRACWVQFRGNGALNTSNETQAFPGIEITVGNQGDPGVTWNNSSTSVRHDPLFVDNKGCKSVFEATGAGSSTTANVGAGEGDYRLQSTSPAKELVTNPIREFTTDGEAVGTNDNMGAMSALA